MADQLVQKIKEYIIEMEMIIELLEIPRHQNSKSLKIRLEKIEKKLRLLYVENTGRLNASEI